MDELFVGKMYYVSENALEEAIHYRNTRYKYALCKCTSKRGKFKIRDGIYRYMKYWVAEKEAKMEKRYSDEKVANYLKAYSDPEHSGWICQLMLDLQDARKELEEVKKDSVWREIPDNVDRAMVHYVSSNDIGWGVPHVRVLSKKTPKQELIDKFSEKNALAMKCANLSKEILEAFVKEYEEVVKK